MSCAARYLKLFTLDKPVPDNALVRLDPAAKTTLRGLQSPGDPDLYLHLLNIFISSSEEYIKLLTKPNSSSDKNILLRITHTWRASAQAIGAQILADLCLQLEKSIPNGDRLTIEMFLKQIDSEYTAVKLELDKEIKAA